MPCMVINTRHDLSMCGVHYWKSAAQCTIETLPVFSLAMPVQRFHATIILVGVAALQTPEHRASSL
jgi:hypothetical protein